uniref:Uncharacterized protein n=1 Tax=Anguilla anguilla TaxID=7936 RepID=A0A0E9XAT5_ANGAN
MVSYPVQICAPATFLPIPLRWSAPAPPFHIFLVVSQPIPLPCPLSSPT